MLLRSLILVTLWATVSNGQNPCDVCGEGLSVTLPDEIFAFPGQPAVPCGTLEGAGEAGLIPDANCPFIPGLIEETCGCLPPTVAPVPEPTPAPVPAPTDAPAPDPTPAPVPNPTPAPLPNPTPAPVQNPTPSPVPNPTPNPVNPVPNPTPVSVSTPTIDEQQVDVRITNVLRAFPHSRTHSIARRDRLPYLLQPLYPPAHLVALLVPTPSTTDAPSVDIKGVFRTQRIDLSFPMAMAILSPVQPSRPLG